MIEVHRLATPLGPSSLDIERFAVAHSFDDWRTRADNPSVMSLEPKAAGGLTDDIPAVMEASMMKSAQQDQVVEVGRTSIQPVLDVVGVRTIRRHTAARKAAESVADLERATLSICWESLRAADIYGQAVALGDGNDVGIATDTAGGLDRERRTAFDKASPAAGFASQKVDVSVDHNLTYRAWTDEVRRPAGEHVLGH